MYCEWFNAYEPLEVLMLARQGLHYKLSIERSREWMSTFTVFLKSMENIAARRQKRGQPYFWGFLRCMRFFCLRCTSRNIGLKIMHLITVTRGSCTFRNTGLKIMHRITVTRGSRRCAGLQNGDRCFRRWTTRSWLRCTMLLWGR